VLRSVYDCDKKVVGVFVRFRAPLVHRMYKYSIASKN
jgi:hypothetical protein